MSGDEKTMKDAEVQTEDLQGSTVHPQFENSRQGLEEAADTDLTAQVWDNSPALGEPSELMLFVLLCLTRRPPVKLTTEAFRVNIKFCFQVNSALILEL